MKRFLALLLSVIIFTVCCFNVSASNIVEPLSSIFTEESETSVTPRYTHIAAVSATIGEKALGFVLCGSTYACSLENYTFTLTCALQRADGSATGWVNYKSTTETFTDAGGDIIEETWFAPAGYAYRTHTTIVVKNSRTSKVVETATTYSPTIYK